jgi:hypothetical protein
VAVQLVSSPPQAVLRTCMVPEATVFELNEPLVVIEAVPPGNCGTLWTNTKELPLIGIGLVALVSTEAPHPPTLYSVVKKVKPWLAIVNEIGFPSAVVPRHVPSISPAGGIVAVGGGVSVGVAVEVGVGMVVTAWCLTSGR